MFAVQQSWLRALVESKWKAPARTSDDLFLSCTLHPITLDARLLPNWVLQASSYSPGSNHFSSCPLFYTVGCAAIGTKSDCAGLGRAVVGSRRTSGIG